MQQVTLLVLRTLRSFSEQVLLTLGVILKPAALLLGSNK